MACTRCCPYDENVNVVDRIAQDHWHARLELGFEHSEARTLLRHRRHQGPLVVQKPFYPEGGDVCHAIVIHPPGGIAGGDQLEIEIGLGTGAQALVTTPGAGKWYRSAGAEASQRLRFGVQDGATLEWLPQETIVFDSAKAHMDTHVTLAPTATFLGWEIMCLGRTASAETFRQGRLRLGTRIDRDDQPVWFERGMLQGGSNKLESVAALAGKPVFGTFLAASPHVSVDLLAMCRQVDAANAEGGVTLLPQLIVARYLGDSAQAARSYFTRLWQILRPALVGRPAVTPRIWNT
jgi:urease accessory protein